jgi:biotin carboxyl carrier protein
MKMEHSVTAPVPGKVAIVRIAAGQQVDEGMVAIVIDSDPVD